MHTHAASSAVSPKESEDESQLARHFVAVVPLLFLGGLPTAIAEEQSLTPAAESGDLSGADDFDFLMGEWRVRHRILRPLKGGTWSEFEGHCIERPLMGGRGNVEEHRFERPTGVTLRRRGPLLMIPRPPSGPSGGSTAACRTATWIRR